MINKCFCYVSLLIACISTQACNKNEPTVKAGNVSLLVYVKHHQVPIAYSSVFVKYNTLVFPGRDTTLYDERKVADRDGFFRFDNLQNGNKEMVVFATGIDPNWDSTQTTRVWGYTPVAINTSLGEDKEAKITIPVSE